MSVDILKKSSKIYNLQHVTDKSLRLYIPQDIRTDSQFPLKDEVIASIVRIRYIDGTEKVGVFLEPAEKGEEVLY